MRVKKQWIVFYDGQGEEIYSMSMTGSFEGEIYDTIGLLAYERNISSYEITFAIVTR